MSNSLLTAKEAARYLAVSVRHLRRLPIRRARIGARVKYLVSDLDLFIAVRMESPARRSRAA